MRARRMYSERLQRRTLPKTRHSGSEYQRFGQSGGNETFTDDSISLGYLEDESGVLETADFQRYTRLV